MASGIERYIDEIERAISEFDIPQEPTSLYNPIRYFMNLGGKRIRPALCLMASDIFSGNKNAAMKLSIGIELFHNFTLIHDDIMDNAPLRRGKTTVHEKWNRDTAILSGDAMMIMAYKAISQSQTDNLNEILSVFNDTALKVCEGQQKDMDFEDTMNVGLEEYLKMIENKTAVLLGASLQMGALSAGANTTNAERMYEVGRLMGIAFQLKDDWLDAFADPDKFGKKQGGDIIEGKKTYLILKALELSDTNSRSELTDLFNNKSINNEEKVGKVLNAYNQLNISDHLQSEMDSYYRQGMSILDEIEGDADCKKELKDLLVYLMDRDH